MIKTALSLGFYVGIVGGMAIADAGEGRISWQTAAVVLSAMLIPAWLGWQLGKGNKEAA